MKKGFITAKKDDIYEKDVYVINVKQVYNDLHQSIVQEISKNSYIFGYYQDGKIYGKGGTYNSYIIGYY